MLKVSKHTQFTKEELLNSIVLSLFRVTYDKFYDWYSKQHFTTTMFDNINGFISQYDPGEMEVAIYADESKLILPAIRNIKQLSVFDINFLITDAYDSKKKWYKVTRQFSSGDYVKMNFGENYMEVTTMYGNRTIVEFNKFV